MIAGNALDILPTPQQCTTGDLMRHGLTYNQSEDILPRLAKCLSPDLPQVGGSLPDLSQVAGSLPGSSPTLDSLFDLGADDEDGSDTQADY